MNTATTAHNDYWSKYQPVTTAVVWGCGHTAEVHLALNPLVALEQIEAYTQIDCLPCAKAKKVQARGITWADVNRSR